jgi:hypothetical protein
MDESHEIHFFCQSMILVLVLVFLPEKTFLCPNKEATTTSYIFTTLLIFTAGHGVKTNIL